MIRRGHVFLMVSLLLLAPLACSNGGNAKPTPGVTDAGSGAAGGSGGGAPPTGEGGTGGSRADGGASDRAVDAVSTRDAASPRDAGTGNTRDSSLVSADGPLPAAMQLIESPCLSVPDPDVAAGPTLVGTAIQWNAYFFKKDTGALDHMYKWVAAQGHLISDTHIVFDSTSQRWYITTIVGLTSPATGVQIMVSTDASATDWKVSVPIMMPRLIDDPMPTVTSDKVVITEHGACVWVFDKAALEAGDAPTVQPTSCTVKQNNQIYAVKYGLQVPSTAYGITGVNSTTLNWIAVDGTPAMNDVKITEHQLNVGQYSEIPVFGGLKQNNMDLESPGVKAMWDQGHLVWTKTMRCPAGMTGCTVMRLFDVDTAANTIQQTDYTLPDTQLFNGAAGIDKFKNVWVLAGEARVDGNVGLALMGHTASGMNFSPSIIVPGGSALSGNRYGDYAAASQDPADGSLWMINQYAGPSKPSCKVVHLTATK